MTDNTNNIPEENNSIAPIETDDFAQDMSDNFDMVDDDFSNSTDDDLLTSDWDDDIDSEFDKQFDNDGDFTSAPAKSDINWFNIGVIGFVVLAAGAIGYNQFFGGNTQPQTNTAIEQAQTAQEKQNLATQALETKQEDTPSPLSLLGNPDLLADSENSQLVETQNNKDAGVFDAIDNASYENEIGDMLSNLKMPTPPQANELEDLQLLNEEQPQDVLPAAMDTAIETQAIENTLPVPADVQMPSDDTFETIVDLSPIEETTIEEPVIETPAEEPAAVETQQNNVVIDNALAQKVAALDERLNSLDTRLDAIMNKLDAQASNASAPVQTSNNDALISKMETTISTLEKKIADLSTKKATAPAPKRVVKSTPKTTTPKVSKPKVTWELRGASPNQAYVAQKGTQNLRTVSVGDTLDGIGRITSIAIENNRWIVRGTNGVITQ